MSHTAPKPPIFEMVALGALTLLAALTLCKPCHASELPPKIGDTSLVWVEDNGGGIVDDFVALRNLWERDHTKVVIAGECSSACTLYTALPTMCVKEDATLNFHAPFILLADHTQAYDDNYTAWFTRQYPKAIQEWIADRGGLTHEWLTLKGSQLKRLLRICD
ncbi:hypothetical protein X747_14625 [Mesorhizobium sp. LNJC384A00]|uniref:hypothetical protein n=1 Tax=Mesorhizobium sp. LNJC384A00 TaxID=1287268 RepID=UPI0003CE1695|nr:hypothetical protein [Mesorhizobium sp. LNJC384A00]ESY42028.1 hypothetical protein X747_14625 [Mesorhizobium sp. LNJC384A00]